MVIELLQSQFSCTLKEGAQKRSVPHGDKEHDPETLPPVWSLIMKSSDS